MQSLGKQLMIFDGGMGSELEKRLPAAPVPEDLNITHPAVIREIHGAYAAADFITTNTFGLNPIKYRGAYPIEEVAHAAISHARTAGKRVFFDLGPTGSLLAPLGTLSFDDAYAAYRQMVLLTRDEVDGYIAETFSDLYELKACVLAVREHTDKPLFATVTFDESGRTLSGATPEIVATVLSGLGVDALGVNCSRGPREMTEVARRLLAVSEVPVIVQPNMGLPSYRNGKTVYDLTEEEFLHAAGELVALGVSVIGGCCGTTPSLISRLADLRGAPVVRPSVTPVPAVCSGTRRLVFDGGVKVCGERLNPTGKKRLKEALMSGDLDYLATEAIRQADAGAHLLDLNVGVGTGDESALMRRAMTQVQEYCDLPLQLDSSSPAALEAGARYYNGVPLLNSVNGEERVMDAVFPIAKKYGAMVLGLTMDERGVPKTARERYEIAARIVERAGEYGIAPHRIVIDTLTLTASAEQAQVKETLEALRLVRALGVQTALGVSNISFGLPARPLLNKTFLTMALASGLTMPIINPCDTAMMDAVRAYHALSGYDADCADYITAYGEAAAALTQPTPQGEAPDLATCILRGLKSRAEAATEEALATLASPMDAVTEILIPALTEVGRQYEEGKLFLPQLLSSAESAKLAFAVLSRRLPKGEAERGRVVLATVKGDVHDIGKNIVGVVLASYGFTVVDLGKDVPKELIAEAALVNKPLAVGLSALMTTTVPAMEQTIRHLREAGVTCPIYVGGAVLTEELAARIGADGYAPDAASFARSLLGRLK